MTHFLPKVIERYTGMHLHEIHYSPLFAHGEGFLYLNQPITAIRNYIIYQLIQKLSQL